MNITQTKHPKQFPDYEREEDCKLPATIKNIMGADKLNLIVVIN